MKDITTFTARPNDRGNQLLSDPLGTGPGQPLLPPVSELVVSFIDHESQTIEWDYGENGQDGFEIEAAWDHLSGSDTRGPDVRHYDSITLPSDTLVTWAVRSFKGNLKSEWRMVAARTDEAPTQPPPGDETDLDRITYFENFEGNPDGAPIDECTDLSGCNNGVIDTSQAFPGGTRCMRTHIQRGNHVGFGDWGFIWEGSGRVPYLTQGGEAWMRLALKYPNGFKFNAQPFTKFLRMGKVRTRDQNNRGYVDAYVDGTRVKFITEYPSDGDSTEWFWSGQDIPIGGWFIFEYYACFHHTSARNGGKGTQRWWLNGVPGTPNNGSTEHQGTLGRDENFARLLWHTHWNENSYEVQHHWCDQVAFAFRGNTLNMGYVDDTPHMARDINGFPYIGTATK